MIAELGHFALILAFAVTLVQASVPLWGAARGEAQAMRLAGPAAATAFLLVGLSFAALTNAFVTSDFSLRVVAANSHSAKPLLYKISGVWGNHEGSMLLWVLILTLFGGLVGAFGSNIPPALKARALAVQGMVGAAFLAFILFTSNPFTRLVPVPADGSGLNPLLQDPGLAFHPPFLYLGYVGLSMPFSFAVAALIEGRVDAGWARWVRPWTLIAWSALTVGIALGSYWAYYELGWGGWWFWDPVENASFMPWLIATALLHSVIVTEKRAALKSWTVLLAILAFSLSLVGTFIVRSGIITSVHAFASDPTRGVFILAMLGVAIGGSLILYAWRAPGLRSEAVFAPMSRESALVLNNLLLAVATAVVFIGTLWPLVIEGLTGDKISVGEPFFDLAFTPLMVLVLLVMPLGAALPWKRGDLGKAMHRLWPAVALAFAVGAVFAMLRAGGPVAAPFAVALAFWAVFGVVVDLAERVKLGRAPLAETGRRLVHLPRAAWGQAVAHVGLGLTAFGIAGVSAWSAEDIRVARAGDTIPIAGYELRFEGMSEAFVANYATETGRFTLLEDGRAVAELRPERRWYPVAEQETVEAAITPRWASDVYVAIGEPREGGARVVRAYHHPLVLYLWGGALMMVAGGAISLTDRRYRVGAPQPKRRAAAPAIAPAE